MDEYVSAAVVQLNESITLRRVEPFHGASRHHGLLVCTNLIAAPRPSCDRPSEVSVALGKAAEKAGLVIKKEHPILQVAVYDGVESMNKIIELP